MNYLPAVKITCSVKVFLLLMSKFLFVIPVKNNRQELLLKQAKSTHYLKQNNSSVNRNVLFSILKIHPLMTNKHAVELYSVRVQKDILTTTGTKEY